MVKYNFGLKEGQNKHILFVFCLKEKIINKFALKEQKK